MTSEQIQRILRQAPVGSAAWLAAMSAQARAQGKIYQPFNKVQFL
jgi:hypothetical protein